MPRKATLDEKLGTEFWTPPIGTITTEAIRLIYYNLVAALRAELKARNASTLDFVLAERAAYMYGIVKEKEALNAVAPDDQKMSASALRTLEQDAITVTTNLKKLWSADDKNSDAAEGTLKKVQNAMMKVFEELSPSEVEELRKKFAVAFAKEGL